MTITQERLEDLRGVLARIPGAECKQWVLEVYDLRDGEQVVSSVVDIKTGKPLKRKAQENGEKAQL